MLKNHEIPTGPFNTPESVKLFLLGLQTVTDGICVYVGSYKALYNYSPQNDDELPLSEGDVVYVIERCQDGW